MNNSAAIGYAIIAAKAIGLKKEEIERLGRTMETAMDFNTEEVAEEVYRKS